jgi:quercetin dioxygenase-like cupin family protein
MYLKRAVILSAVVLLSLCAFGSGPRAEARESVAMQRTPMMASPDMTVPQLIQVAMSSTAAKEAHLRIFRLYTGPDKRSHLEQLKLPFAPGEVGEQSPKQRAKTVFFTMLAPGTFINWHNAPRRQYVISVVGSMEVGLGDGTFHRFGQGEGVLAEDLTGQGHTTRVIGEGTRISIVIPLAD